MALKVAAVRKSARDIVGGAHDGAGGADEISGSPRQVAPRPTHTRCCAMTGGPPRAGLHAGYVGSEGRALGTAILGDDSVGSSSTGHGPVPCPVHPQRDWRVLRPGGQTTPRLHRPSGGELQLQWATRLGVGADGGRSIPLDEFGCAPRAAAVRIVRNVQGRAGDLGVVPQHRRPRRGSIRWVVPGDGLIRSQGRDRRPRSTPPPIEAHTAPH